jgi:hypothetical protein
MTIVIFSSIALAVAVLLCPCLTKSRRWRATITPLASIIGSGFLVLGPILHASFGLYAPLAMLGLCVLAYMFGAAVRFNIRALETQPPRPATADRIETMASRALAFAYVVSVTYYLNLFGAFAVSLTPFDSPMGARLATSAVFILILGLGVTRGFTGLERVEQISVGIKLSIIAGLLAGLALYFNGKLEMRALVFSQPAITGWPALTLAFGLLITVQGFETSRYLGETYDAATRIRSMKTAQYVSAAIYLLYIWLLSYSFAPTHGAVSETGIIEMMAVVSPVLPLVLVVAALSAQLSAAIADTSGAGGLTVELSRGRISGKQAYMLLVAAGLILTWSTDIFRIINYASRAFAFYYALQALIAMISSPDKTRKALFGALALLGVLITLFGRAVEGA